MQVFLVVVLCAGCFLAPQSSAQFAPSMLAPGRDTGHVTYTLRRPQGVAEDQQQILDQIDQSMKIAVAYYNRYTKLRKHVTVVYHPSIPTADGNINGAIRVGGCRNTRTLMHELGHVMGVGQHRAWGKLAVDHQWRGGHANKLLQEFTGDPNAQLHCDRLHFWPYGLNYDRELKSEEDMIRHARLVEAIVEDLAHAR